MLHAKPATNREPHDFSLVRLGLAVAAPLLPLTLTMIPLEEILDRAINTVI